MRLLLVTDFFPPVRGGLETYVDELAAHLAERGHDVHVATMTPDAQPRHHAVTVHTVRTLSSRVLRHEHADRPFHPPLPDPVARRDLARVIEDVRPDVVHVHTWLGVSLPPTAAPMILTAHEYALLCQRRTLLRADGTRCAQPSLRDCWSCGSAALGAVKSALLGAGTVAGRRLLHPDLVLTLSQHVARRVSPYVDAPVRVIPGFVTAPPTAAARPIPGRYVMYAGDPGTHKGLPLLLEAWRQWQPSDVELLVAVTKPLDLPTPAGVVVRRMAPAEVMSAWAHADAAVVPSQWDEPFGMVAIEALTAGTPVIASAVGALPELVSHRDNGLLVEPGDRDELVNAMRLLVADAPLRERLAAGARQSAARFSPRAVVPTIEAAYAEVLDSRRSVA